MLTKIEFDKFGCLVVNGQDLNYTTQRVVVALLHEDAPGLVPGEFNHVVAIKLIRATGLCLRSSKDVVDFLRIATAHPAGNFEVSNETWQKAYNLFI